jgi:hypothetical protein
MTVTAAMTDGSFHFSLKCHKLCVILEQRQFLPYNKPSKAEVPNEKISRK